MHLYIAGPLFTQEERHKSKRIRDIAHEAGHTTFLPAEDGAIAFDTIHKGANPKQTRQEVFDGDVDAIDACDGIIAILDGRVPDEGMCIELGMAHAKHKLCIGYLTDPRKLDEFGPNLMIEGCLSHLTHTNEELQALLKKL